MEFSLLVNICLICILIPNYEEQLQTKGFKSQFRVVWFRSGFGVVSNLPLRKIRFRKVQSIFSHFVRKDTLLLSETISGLFGRYDYYTVLEDKKIIFSLCNFYLIKRSRERATEYHAPLGNMVTMAPPLLV